MADDLKQLREALISAFEHLQQHNSELQGLTREIASIRESLIQIEPRYDDISTRHRARRARETKPSEDASFQEFDAIIQQLRGR
jgi:chromosome segregation ATPase